jgi:hypothetical protein
MNSLFNMSTEFHPQFYICKYQLILFYNNFFFSFRHFAYKGVCQCAYFTGASYSWSGGVLITFNTKKERKNNS